MTPPVRLGTGIAAGLLAVSTIALTSARSTREQLARECLVRGPVALPAGAPADLPSGSLARQGLVFVSIAWSDRVVIIDLATGQRTDLESGIDEPHEVAVSPDGRWGVAADFGRHLGDAEFDGRRLAVFDLARRRLARVIDLGEYRGPHDLTFISPRRLLVTVQTSKHVLEVDVEDGRIVGAVPTGARGSHTLAVTPDGRTAYTANQPDGTISKLDVAGRSLVAVHRVTPRTIEGIAVSADGREVWTGVGDEGAVRVLDGTSGRVLADLRGFSTPERMAGSADGSLVAITDFRCEVLLVADARARRILGPVAGLPGAGVAKVLPDNRTAVVLMLDEREIAMVDLVHRRVLRRIPLGGRRPDAAAWGPPPG